MIPSCYCPRCIHLISDTRWEYCKPFYRFIFSLSCFRSIPTRLPPGQTWVSWTFIVCLTHCCSFMARIPPTSPSPMWWPVSISFPNYSPQHWSTFSSCWWISAGPCLACVVFFAGGQTRSTRHLPPPLPSQCSLGKCEQEIQWHDFN